MHYRKIELFVYLRKGEELERAILLPVYREKIKSYITFTDKEWEVFADFLEIKKRNKNECFATTGEICEDLGYIFKGSVRYCSIVDGLEITGYFAFENNFVTALKSFLTGYPSLYDIITLEKTIFIIISKKNMQVLLEHPLLSFKMERLGRLISERFNILFEDRIKSFIVKTPEERYLDLLESGQDIVKRIPLQYIAQFIGITPVSLSRIRKRIHQYHHS
ncbi:Crp/Fnr family transcriptional regulator [Panacibacter ginsenosidivorans]|uniref:Crp/Fnr family transcriptional regulator n=1 Tax=Panacibacter ginsenosidivorans TaxID=1813871 RepID=A0A5B8VBR4_9BACT|nr:Crp/Fnr family transcriptional regulator [Panacibacter ginsenosidivorans]QEC68967.1 Crp/Fnr family transcriptional regulator [Panacibacter ginsenosidivorans]